MQNYIQQTDSAHPNYQYIVIIRVRTQHVQVVLTSTTLAQHCARQVCLLALPLTSASLCALATSQVHQKTAGLGNCGALIVAFPIHDLPRILLSTHAGLVHLVFSGCF